MNTADRIVQKTIEKMDQSTRTLVLVWAQKAHDILKREDLPTVEKVRLLTKLGTKPAITSFVLAISSILKQHLWKDRSWAARGAVSGLAIGVAVAGSQGAGIAAMGGAIGVPLFLVTASGGALLGAVITELGGTK